MDLEIRTTTVDVSQLHAACRDLAITPARLVAIGFDTRMVAPGREAGIVEIQHLVSRAGEAPQRVHEFDITHRPSYAYLWNIQMRHGRAVVEGDPDLAKVVGTLPFARAYDALASLLRRGDMEPQGEVFLVGSSLEPLTWDASGRGFAPIFGEGSQRRFLRIRRNDILWAEGERLVAAPVAALGEAATFTKTRTVHATSGAIAMISKALGWSGTRVIVSTGRNVHTEIELGSDASSPDTKPLVTRSSPGRGLFIGHADQGRGLKALISLEIGTKGQWRLAIYPVEGPKAPAIIADRAVS